MLKQRGLEAGQPLWMTGPHALVPVPLRVVTGKERASLERGISSLSAPPQMWSLEVMLAKSWEKYAWGQWEKEKPMLNHTCVYTPGMAILFSMTMSLPTPPQAQPPCRRIWEDCLWSCPAPKVGRKPLAIPLPLRTKPCFLRRCRSYYIILFSILSIHSPDHPLFCWVAWWHCLWLSLPWECFYLSFFTRITDNSYKPLPADIYAYTGKFHIGQRSQSGSPETRCGPLICNFLWPIQCLLTLGINMIKLGSFTHFHISSFS